MVEGHFDAFFVLPAFDELADDDPGEGGAPVTQGRLTGRPPTHSLF